MSDNAMTPDARAPRDASPEALAGAVRRFGERAIVPREADLARGGANARRIVEALARDTRSAGLWGLFHPVALGGRFAKLADYLPVAEQEGRSEYGPTIFGGRATLDLHMLHRHASPQVRERFVSPLAAGRIDAAYAMSEPDQPGSVPATLETRATLRDGRWCIDGRKWFVSRAAHAAFVTVVARTRDRAPPEQAFSLIVVPTDAPGFRIEREIDVFGQPQGQCELSFECVAVPEAFALGAPGEGFALMRERLTLGRALNAGHWVGLAQRCYDLMGARICSPRGTRARLSDKQLIRLRMLDTYQAIAAARAQLQCAARLIDAGAAATLDVNLAKLAAARALNIAVDAAIQVHGAEGVSDATPLASIHRAARTVRILDGADEALISSVGQQLIDAFRTSGPEDEPCL